MIFVSSKIPDGNMALNIGIPEEASKNRKKFFKSLGISPNSVVEVKQIHGNKVIYIDKPVHDELEADGMITNKRGIYLIVKIADCIPIGLYDPKHNAIGLIHTGWRGLEDGIIKNTVRQMKKYFKTDPKRLVIKFAPSIGPCHYRMDLWIEAESQLISCSVLKKNIDNRRICTYESKEYFSHRRAEDTNLPDFRFVTILGLNHVN